MAFTQKLIMTREQIHKHMREYIANLKAKGYTDSQINNKISTHYTNNIVKKYTKDEMDAMWAVIYDIIMNVPGGLRMLIDNMDYMPEFEHYRFKSLVSTRKILDKKRRKFEIDAAKN